MDWAVRYLRNSRELLLDLGDGDQAASVGSDLAGALQVSDYGDVYAKMAEAEAVLRDVVAYRSRSAGQAGMLATSLTNLAVVLLRAAQLDKRQDRVQEAADLCRTALRPKAEDPYGWAFTAGNLALALTRLADDDPVTRRTQLEEAAAVGLEVAAVFDARGDFAAADLARVNRLETLLVLEAALRDGRLRAAVSSDIPVSPSDLAALLDRHPGFFGLAETPPEVSAALHAPAPPEETRTLEEVLAESGALLAEPRTSGNPATRSQLARLTAMASQRLLGPGLEAADAVAAARHLMDATATPDNAALTSAELGSLLAQLDRWAEAAAAYDDCLAVVDATIQDSASRDRVMQTLTQFRPSPGGPPTPT